MFSKKSTKIDEIFTVDLTLCSKCQIDGEDFGNFCGLLRKHELYKINLTQNYSICVGRLEDDLANLPIYIEIILIYEVKNIL